MEPYLLRVENLCKKFPAFTLDNVSFSLEPGYIMGFIGKNGAGKTTTLKAVLHLIHPDAGTVTAFGRDFYRHETELKPRIGFALNGSDFYPHTRIQVLTDVYKRFYDNWDESVYADCLARFGLDESKRVKELSAGMRIKLGITYALSHRAELLVFDEPTGGLDPVARDDLLDLFREIVSDGDRSILFSTHVTSDLDRCADYILYIDDGKVIACDTKDDLLGRHALVRGGAADLDAVRGYLIGCKTNAFGFTGLALKDDLPPGLPLETAAPDLQELMIYYDKENRI